MFVVLVQWRVVASRWRDRRLTKLASSLHFEEALASRCFAGWRAFHLRRARQRSPRRVNATARQRALTRVNALKGGGTAHKGGGVKRWRRPRAREPVR